MKKYLNIIPIAFLSSLILVGCMNSAESSSADDSGEYASGGGITSGTKYTLSFDANYPTLGEESEFVDTENGNTYYYDNISFTSDEQSDISVSGTSATIRLEASPYGYCKRVKESESVSRIITKYLFSHYNTENDGSGVYYAAGDEITLDSDMTLYCFYAPDYDESSVIKLTKQAMSFSMKVGETLRFLIYYDDITETSFNTNSGNTSRIVKVTADDFRFYNVEAIAAGNATINVVTFATKNTDSQQITTINITVTGGSSGSGAGKLAGLLPGIWEANGSSYSGTLTFNTDGTGHIKVMLGGRTAHDTGFSWTASESSTMPSFTISGASGGGSLNGSHYLENASEKRFTLTGYLAFGMPERTTWTKK